MAEKVTIIGVGSEIRGDDALGPRIIAELGKESSLTDVELQYAGLDSMNLLNFLLETDAAIIVDAVNMNRAPGSVAAFTLAEVRLIFDVHQLSLHGMSLAYVLTLAESMGRLPKKLVIVGAQPFTTEGLTLSPEMEKILPEVLRQVKEQISFFQSGLATPS